LAVTPDGQKVISIGKDDRYGVVILIWILESCEILSVTSLGQDMITAVAVTPDSQRAVTTSAITRAVVVWDLNTSKIVHELTDDTGSRKETVAIAPEGHYAISGGDKGDVIYWDIEKEEEVFRLLHHEVDVNEPNYWQHPGQFVHSVAFYNDGQGIMSAARDGTIKLWDVETRALKLYTNLKTTLTACVISNDGKHIITGDESGQVYFLTSEDFITVT
jgi:WD40 repeat protein